MKLLFIIPSYKPAFVYGGPIRSVSFLAESLVQAGHKVMVYTTLANGKEDLDLESGNEYSVEGVHVRYFRRITRGHSNFSPKLLLELNREIHQYDIVHLHSWWNLVVMPAALICRWRGVVPVISPRGTISGYTFHYGRRHMKKILHYFGGKHLLERASIHCTSEKEDQEIEVFVQNPHRYILPNILELPDKICSVYNPASYLKIVFLGRIDPSKNIELLISVFTGMLKIPYRFTIAGVGEAAYVATLKGKTAGNSDVTWAGPIEGMKKFELLAQADLLVLSSHTENYGNVVVEALSQGTPVLISRHVGAMDFVEKYNLGWISDDSPEDWNKVLEKIWLDKEGRDAIRHRAPECVAMEFKTEKLAASYLDMYAHHLKGWNKS